ncbi:MAG: hypothetical protein QY326_05090 [Bdellovibrionota bacterium]|nr:MAG: hypothetical protein QY326_05090 [Bdellovibrionota bacterium]
MFDQGRSEGQGGCGPGQPRGPESAQSEKAAQVNSAQRQQCLAEFLPQEVAFEGLTSSETAIILKNLFPDVEAEFFEQLVQQIGQESPDGVESILTNNQSQADISLASYTEVKVTQHGPISIGGFRFCHGGSPADMSIHLAFDLLQGEFTLRLVWDEECYGYHLRDESRWEAVSYAFYALRPNGTIAGIYDQRLGLKPGITYRLFDGAASVRLGNPLEHAETFLGDAHVALRPDLLPFVLPGRFEEIDTRVAQIHHRIVGKFPNNIAVVAAENAEERAALTRSLLEALQSEDGAAVVLFIESEGILLPITARMTAESVEADFRLLSRLQQNDLEVRDSKQHQEPTRLLVHTPEVHEIVSILSRIGYFAEQPQRSNESAAAIRAFLLGTDRLEIDSFMAPINTEGARIKVAEVITSDAGRAAELLRCVEFAPAKDSELPIVRIYAQPPPIEEETIVDMDGIVDEDPSEDAEQWSEEHLEAESEDGEEFDPEPLEILQPSDLFLMIQWPDTIQDRPTQEALAERWRLIDSVHTTLGETAVPADLSALAQAADDRSIRRLSERAQVQLSSFVRTAMGSAL